MWASVFMLPLFVIAAFTIPDDQRFTDAQLMCQRGILLLSISFSTPVPANCRSTPTKMVAWLSGSALVSINVVTLHRGRLILGWVTVCGRVHHLGM